MWSRAKNFGELRQKIDADALTFQIEDTNSERLLEPDAELLVVVVRIFNAIITKLCFEETIKSPFRQHPRN
jgi:hypothetical protein